jgi:hypothetical protein
VSLLGSFFAALPNMLQDARCFVDPGHSSFTEQKVALPLRLSSILPRDPAVVTGIAGVGRRREYRVVLWACDTGPTRLFLPVQL